MLPDIHFDFDIYVHEEELNEREELEEKEEEKEEKKQQQQETDESTEEGEAEKKKLSKKQMKEAKEMEALKNQMLDGSIILQGDQVNLKLTVRRLHGFASSSSQDEQEEEKKGSSSNNNDDDDDYSAPSIYSSRCPLFLQEYWWALILDNKGNVKAIKRITDQSSEFEKVLFF